MEKFENVAYANIMILMCSEICVTRKNKTNQLNKQEHTPSHPHQKKHLNNISGLHNL